MNEQIEINLQVNLAEASVLINSLGENKLNDVLPLFLKLKAQSEEQLAAYQVKQEGALKEKYTPKPEKE